MDPSLYPATRLAADLDAIATGAEPGPRLDIDTYAEGHRVADAPRLQLILLDALRTRR